MVWLVAAILATWRLTWDLTSTEKLEGPFKIYDGVRWLFEQTFWPKWVRNNAQCPYCVSFWAGCLFAFVAVFASGEWRGPLVESLGMWFLYAFAAAGVTAFWYRYVRLVYAVEAKEF